MTKLIVLCAALIGTYYGLNVWGQYLWHHSLAIPSTTIAIPYAVFVFVAMAYLVLRHKA